MKKGLSVLLIAAALFGFYGGAVNLNDVLACKDYWEEKGEQTTADLNKLEDGINQLKDNEEAYLDGVEAVAKGEKDLAKGEEDYAAGQAELAKGEAEYAAAPGKLADARAQIAKGEEDLAAGEAKLAAGYKEYNQGKQKLADGKAALASGAEDLEKVKTLIGGMQQIVDGYPEWKNGYEALKNGRIDTLKNPSDTSDLVQVLTAYYTKASDAAAGKALQDLQKAGTLLKAQDATKYTNEQYDGFNDYLNATVTALEDSNAFFDNTKKNLSNVASSFQKPVEDATAAAGTFSAAAAAYQKAGAAAKAAKEAFEADPTSPENQQKLQEAGKALQDAEKDYGAALKDLNDKLAVCQNTASNTTLVGAVQLATGVFIQPKDAATAQQVLGALQAAQGGLTIAQDGSNAASIKPYLTAVGTIPVAMGKVNEGISDIQKNTLNPGISRANQWLDGYKTITGSATVGKQQTIVGGVAKIIGGVLNSGNDQLIDGMNQVAGAVGFTPSQFANASTSKLAKDMASSSKLENFYQDMNKIEKGFTIVIPQLQGKKEAGEAALAAGEKEVKAGAAALKVAEKQLADGETELAAGRAKLADGKAQYAQGLADFAAAPGKLAAGRQQLAEGLQKLMDGRKELADGKEKLAEYEDGEQQVRDGLATLVGTKPDGGLTSILDRLDGDDNFNDKAGHLVLDEGLDAVTVGRGYQSDSGELVTEEITKRAVGTGVGLGAAALAVLAGILSLLKKNKGAGIAAILTAAAGAAGVAVGTGSGMEFSHIAGSHMGSMPWVAAGILAGVAVLHAIVHFMQKKEEVDA